MGLRRKYYKGFCQKCDSLTRMKLIGRDEGEKFYRLRCQTCSSVVSFSVQRLLKSGRVLTEKEFAERQDALSEVQTYDPLHRYWRGQEIWHPVLEDTGEIVEKRNTEDHNHVIVVDFENHGKKELLEQSEFSL